MSALQEALQWLSPTTWDSVPSDPSALHSYMSDIAAQAHLIVDSVPEPPPLADSDPHTYQHNHTPSSPCTIHITPSSARYTSTTNTPSSPHAQEWSKPIKVASPRDNPLDIPVYKLPGTDGKGAWFGRRSVHEGLSFKRWQAKLSSEMGHTLRANQEKMRKGRTPDQSVRGIGAEKVVEAVEVRDDKGEGKKVGDVTVYHVSAQFPRPTTARDFVACIFVWDVQRERESQDGGGGDGGGGGGEKKKGAEGGEDESKGGRFWMMVSKPCLHPDVPPNQGYIRGEYESVEFIREIPVSSGKKKGDDQEREDGGAGEKEAPEKDQKDRGSREKQDRDEESEEEMYPVEWVMVTRSDPGGNIPRWMVEKGTPKSICTDAAKFLDWACQDEPEPGKQADGTRKPSQPGGFPQSDEEHSTTDESDSDLSGLEDVEHHGLIASFAYLLNAGVERYAPQAVLDYLPQHSRNPSARTSLEHEIEHRTSAGSHPHKTSTEESEKQKDEDTRSQISRGKMSTSPSVNSVLATPLTETGPNDAETSKEDKKKKKEKMTSHEKQLVKLAERKREVETQLDKVRADIQSLGVEPTPEQEAKRDKTTAAALASADGAEPVSSDQVSSSAASIARNQSPSPDQARKQAKHTSNPSGAKMQKVASGLFNDETKLLKQLGKIEKNQLKEAAKIEDRAKKDAGQKEKEKSRSENGWLRHENEQLKRELERLRSERKQWLDLIASLQNENSRLVEQGQGQGQK